MKNPATAAEFAAAIHEARTIHGEAPIHKAIPVDTIKAEVKGNKTRIVGTNTETGATVRLSVWQPDEQNAVNDAMARAFC